MSNRNVEIDRLRAIAILMTLWAHADGIIRGQMPLLESIRIVFNGSGGVILFFVISGYVITGSLLPQLKQGEKKAVVAAFLFRRLTRITPMAILWVTIPLVLCFTMNSSGAFGDPRSTVWAALSCYFNYNNIYGRIVPTGDIIEIYWSLSLEEQFYISFPILLLICRTDRSLLFALAVICILPNALPLWIRMAFRVEGICLGVMLFVVRDRISIRLTQHQGLSASVTLFILLMVVEYFFRYTLPSWAYFPLMPILSLGLVWLAAERKGYILPFDWSRAFLNWLGTRSYAIYLIHYTAYMFATEITSWNAAINNVLPRACIALITIIFLAELCYRYIEKPITIWGRRRAAEMWPRSSKVDLIVAA